MEKTVSSGGPKSSVQTYYKARNVLTIDERIDVIHAYERNPVYQRIAEAYKCSAKQIKGIIANKDAHLRLYHNSKTKKSDPEIEDKRGQKIAFLEKVIYEFVERAVYYNISINAELVRQKAIQVKESIAIANFYPNNVWIENFKQKYKIPYFETNTLKGILQIDQAKPSSFNAIELIEYVSRREAGVKNDPLNSTSKQAAREEREPKVKFLNKAIYEFLERAVYYSQPLSAEIVLQKAAQISKIIDIKKFQPGESWLQSFKKQYRIVQFDGQLLRAALQICDFKEPTLSPMNIIDYVSHLEKKEQASTEREVSVGKRQKKIDLLNKIIYEFLERAVSQNRPLTAGIVLQKAKELTNIIDIPNFKPDKDWLTDFQKGHKIPDFHIMILKKLLQVKQSKLTSLDSIELIQYVEEIEQREKEFKQQQKRVLQNQDRNTNCDWNNRSKRTKLTSTPENRVELSHETDLGKDAEEIITVVNEPLYLNLVEANEATIAEQMVEIETEHADEMSNESSSRTSGTTVKIELDLPDELPALNEPCSNTMGNVENLLTEAAVAAAIKEEGDEFLDIEPTTKQGLVFCSHANSPSASEPPPLPDIDNVKEALRHLKALEDYAMLRENYRAIGLLSQLEVVFRNPPHYSEFED